MLKTLSSGITAVISTAAIIPSTYTISGTVSSAGVILPGVTVTLSGKSSGSTTTDALGYYYFTGLTAGSYSVSASMTGYSISPASIPVTITNTNQIGKNFTATPIYAISGTITEDASPLSGVTVTLTGDGTGSKVTGAGGTYSFTGLADGDYIVTPTLAGYTFGPTHKDIALSGADSTGNDFEATAGVTTLLNASFETWTSNGTPGVSSGACTNWTAYSVNGGTCTKSSTAHSGSYSANIRSNSSGNISSIGGCTSDALALNNAYLNWWQKDETTEAVVTVSLLDADNADALLDSYDAAYVPNNQWGAKQWDVSAYIGRNVKVRFEQHTNHTPYGWYTLIDEITFSN